MKTSGIRNFRIDVFSDVDATARSFDGGRRENKNKILILENHSSRKLKMKKMNLRIAACMTLFAAAIASGCFGLAGGFSLGIFGVPVPVSPYFQGAYEDMAFEKDRYGQVPVLPPIVDGVPEGLDAPSDDEVIRLLEKAKPNNGGVPFLETRYRNNVKIKKELIADYVDPPRFFPMVGPVQVHHVHYKCTVYFEQNVRVGWPIPYSIEKKDAQEVIYIDKDHLLAVANAPEMGDEAAMPQQF
jgi:hypothetical protein